MSGCTAPWSRSRSSAGKLRTRLLSSRQLLPDDDLAIPPRPMLEQGPSGAKKAGSPPRDMRQSMAVAGQSGVVTHRRRSTPLSTCFCAHLHEDLAEPIPNSTLSPGCRNCRNCRTTVGAVGRLSDVCRTVGCRTVGPAVGPLSDHCRTCRTTDQGSYTA